MFINSNAVTPEERLNYIKLIKSEIFLQTLENENAKIHYTTSEKVFAKSFHLTDVTKDNSAFDSVGRNLGFQDKTIFNKDNSLIKFKISEFKIHQITKDEDFIKEISKEFNKRIETSLKSYGVSEAIYHILERTSSDKINIYETNMDLINIDKMNILEIADNSITFSDNINLYNYSKSKSCLHIIFNHNKFNSKKIRPIIIERLYKHTENFKSKILEITSESIDEQETERIKILDELYYPLGYNNKEIPSKSGINLGHATGNVKKNDAYLTIPKEFIDFFPKEPFILNLSDGRQVETKITKKGYLMTTPNCILGEYINEFLLKDYYIGKPITNKLLKKAKLNGLIIYKKEDTKTKEIFYEMVGSVTK